MITQKGQMQKRADCLTPFYHLTAAESHFDVTIEDNSESPAKILQDQFLIASDFSKELTVNCI